MQSSESKLNRALRRKLLGTASALAMVGLLQVPQAARAGTSGDTDPNWSLSATIVGQATFNSGSRTNYGDPSGSNPQVGINAGGDGVVALNLSKFGWNFGLSFNYGHTSDSHAGFGYSDATFPFFAGTGDVRHNESHKIIDFTAGQDVGLGWLGLDGMSVFSAGVEWANFGADTVGNFSYSSKYFSTSFARDIHRRFNGIGPVISWDASTRIGDPGCHLSLSWGAMASVLFGNRKAYGLDFDSRSHSATVPRVSAYLGVGWHPDDSPYTLSVGYALQSTWGVLDGNFDLDGDEESSSVNRLSHGPYAAVTVRFH
jgi:hypothetical protein